MGLLEDKVGLVTGAGRGIGRETALVFGREGARVVVADVDFEAAKETAALVEAEGFEALAIEVDVADEASVERMIASTLERFGRLDCASNNAALGAGFRPSTELDRARWDRCLAVTLTGVFLTFREALSGMKSGGRLIAISSVAGLAGEANVAAYSAAKHGVMGLVKSLALEVAKSGITCNAVCPGWVDTPMAETAVANTMKRFGVSREEAEARVFGDNPAGRIVKPEEVAAAVRYLASAEAAMVNGHGLVISGGEA